MRHTPGVEDIRQHLYLQSYICTVVVDAANHTLQGLTSEQSVQRLVDGAVVAGLSGVVIRGVDEQLNVSVTVL